MRSSSSIALCCCCGSSGGIGKMRRATRGDVRGEQLRVEPEHKQEELEGGRGGGEGEGMFDGGEGGEEGYPGPPPPLTCGSLLLLSHAPQHLLARLQTACPSLLCPHSRSSAPLHAPTAFTALPFDEALSERFALVHSGERVVGGTRVNAFRLKTQSDQSSSCSDQTFMYPIS